MANYYATSRTNTFRVKDPKAFKAWAEKIGIKVHERADASGFVLFPNDMDDCGTFPSYDSDAEDEIDFANQLSAHLAEGSVAVIVEAGAEKLRYVHGHAIAVDCRGRQVCVALDDIYTLATKEFGGEISRAEY